MQVKRFGLGTIAIISVLGAALGVVGCGAGPQEIVPPSQADVNKMTQLRAIFDRVHGDYSQTTEAEKKQFLEYGHGKQAEVDHLWAFMTNPRGGGIPANANQNRPFSQGPNGQILPPEGSGGAPR